MPTLLKTMVWEECCRCAISFGVTEDFQRRRREDKKLFYCPSGHGMHYLGKSTDTLLQEERDRVARIQSQLDQKSAALRDAYTGLPGDLVEARAHARRFSTRRQVAWWNGYRDAECGGKTEEDTTYPKAFGWHGAWAAGFRLRRKQMGAS